MSVDTQTEGAVLKDVFENFIADQLVKRHKLNGLIRRDTKSFKGKSFNYIAKVGRSAGLNFTGEGALLVDADQQKHVEITGHQRKLMARVEFTWEAMNDSSSNAGAYKSLKRDEMQGMIKDIARREEATLSLDGRGVLARIDEADPDGDNTLELDAPGGVTGDDFGNRFIYPGMYIAAVNPATGAIRSTGGAKKVTAVNSDGTDVTVATTGATDWANSDYIVQAANASVTTEILDTSYEQAWWGLLGLVDDGTYRSTYFGVDRNVYTNYQSYVVSSTGALSFDLMQRVADVVDQRLGGEIDHIICHHSIRRLYIQMLEADRRYTGARLMNPNGGTKAFSQGDLAMGEVPVTAIRDFPLGTMMFLDTANSDFVEYVSEKGKWVDEDGSVLVRSGTGTSARDKFEAWYRIRKQLHCRYPGYNARLDGITGQTLVVARAE